MGGCFCNEINYMCVSNLPAKMFLAATPTCFSTTSPFLKNKVVGMFLMPYFAEMPELLSTFTLPTTALPS